MPVEIFMRQGVWASISKGSVMVSFKWFTIAHINPEIVFRRALVLTNGRDDVTIDNILSHPVGPIPVSMFHEDVTMRKSYESDLVKQFENEVSPVQTRARLKTISGLI
jgi:hypothetical protein